MVVVPRTVTTTLLAIALTAALVSGCGTRDSGPALHLTAANAPAGMQVLAADPSKAPAAKASPTDVQALCDGNAEFAFDLYRELATGDANLVFSPYSISTALAMAYAGAAGTTAMEMETVMHFPVKGDALHAALAALDGSFVGTAGDPKALDKRRSGAKSKGGHVLRIANALWPDKSLTVRQPFLDTLAKHYRAGVAPLDLSGDSEGSRAAINDWVSGQTEGRIAELLPPGGLQQACLVLTDAVYFAGTWKYEFESHATKDRDFHRLGGDTVTAPMMGLTENLGYAKGDVGGVVCEALALPYSHAPMSMVILLPSLEDFAALERSATGPEITALLGAMAQHDVEATIPSFEFHGATVSLKPALQGLGMTTAFTARQADFSGISDLDPWIGEVFHQAMVAVDEHGTEAAAATAVRMDVKGVGPRPDPETVRFHADHPFLFLIRDDKTGTILFLGRVMDPTA